jgi:hypothetical protein
MARYDIGRHAKTTAVKRSLARRERDVEVSEAFLLKIERGVLRRAKRTDALFKRAGMEEYHVPRVVEDSVRRLSVEIRQLPQSGRRLTRLRRDEVETVLALIVRGATGATSRGSRRQSSGSNARAVTCSETSLL